MNSTYFAALAEDYSMGRERGIDAALQQHNLDALILPATGWTTTPPGMTVLHLGLIGGNESSGLTQIHFI